MNRIIFVDQMGDKREIKIDNYGFAQTFYNGQLTGKFNLHNEEIDAIMNADNSDQAFEIFEKF